jgi:hypothetical protein
MLVLEEDGAEDSALGHIGRRFIEIFGSSLFGVGSNGVRLGVVSQVFPQAGRPWL